MSGTSHSFPGIYSCPFDEVTGRCISNASNIVDTAFVGGSRERGPLLSNVRINALQDKTFALRTESLWEILWTPLNASETLTSSPSSNTNEERSLSAYFRLPKLIFTDRSKGQDCAKYDENRFAYYEVLPVAFAIDENDDVFISWEGYFQDCEDANESGNGLVWSVGVNKVDRSCVMSDTIQTFDECTVPHSIFYRGLLGKDRRLGNGFEISSSPANRHLYYLSVVNRAYGVNNANELWVAPEGIHKWPTLVPTPQLPYSTGYQATRIIPDVASIRLRLDQNHLPRAVCQTAYHKGVYCYSFEVDDDGTNIDVYSSHTEPIFVISEQQVADSCTMDTTVSGGEAYMSGLATGLEVVWGDDDSPDVVLFGCYGGLPDRGNMTAVLRDGSITQVLDGAFPGSILFGIEVVVNQSDSNPNSFPYEILRDESSSKKDSDKMHFGLIVSIVGASIAFIVAIVLLHSRVTKKKASVVISSARRSFTSKIPVEEETTEMGMDGEEF